MSWHDIDEGTPELGRNVSDWTLQPIFIGARRGRILGTFIQHLWRPVSCVATSSVAACHIAMLPRANHIIEWLSGSRPHVLNLMCSTSTYLAWRFYVQNVSWASLVSGMKQRVSILHFHASETVFLACQSLIWGAETYHKNRAVIKSLATIDFNHLHWLPRANV